jgi:AAA+ superfamily predicted ATPase
MTYSGALLPETEESRRLEREINFRLPRDNAAPEIMEQYERFQESWLGRSV